MSESQGIDNSSTSLLGKDNSQACITLLSSFPKGLSSSPPSGNLVNNIPSIDAFPSLSWDFKSSLVVKNPPAMQEMWVQSMDWEDPLEKEMTIHSSILSWNFHG